MEKSLEEYLYQAIRDNDIDNVSVLLSKGANPNMLVNSGMTCLCEAAYMGNIDILNLLISASNNSNSTITSDCSRKHSRKCHKRKIKCDGQNGATSIKCKNLNDRKECRKLDKNRGYFVFIHSEGSSSDESRISSLRSPLSPTSLTASPQADLEWDEEIGNSAASTSEDEQWTSLYKWYAAILETSGAYIAAGSISIDNGIDQQDGFSKTALHYAVEAGNECVVKLLIEAGCKVEVPDSDGFTPLHVAVIENDVEICKFLIEAGGNVNNITHEKVTPLHFAAKKGLLDLVKCLVHNGAQLEARDLKERTALHHAAKYGHLDVVKYLTSCGANVNGEDIRGHTPLFEAVWRESAPMVEVLLNYGARITHTHYLLHTSIFLAQDEIVKLLLHHGASVNLHNEYGDTPLLAALRTSQPHIAKMLLQKGANVNATSTVTGTTALHRTLSCIPQEQFEDTLKCLIEYNIDLNAVATLVGNTVLYRALSTHRDSAAVLLIRHGADVNACDLKSCELDNLSIASLRKTHSLARMLLKAGHRTINIDSTQLEKNFTLQWVYNACRNPLNLSDICRIKIRCMCRSRQLYRYIDSLPLPVSLKRFLKMEDEQWIEDQDGR